MRVDEQGSSSRQVFFVKEELWSTKSEGAIRYGGQQERLKIWIRSGEHGWQS